MRARLAIVTAMIAVAATGDVFIRAVANVVPNAPESGPHGAYLAVLRTVPIPVVQEATGWGVLIAVWALFGALGLLGWMLARSGARLRTVTLSFAATAAVLTLFPIAQSIDVYYYAAYGRLYGVHGINPYQLLSPLHLSDVTLDDNLRPLSNPPFSDSYGPGFTLIAGLTERLLANASLWWQLWVWRAAATISALIVIAALARKARSVDAASSVRKVAAFAFHPLVLYESAVGGHNDWLMVAPAVWAFTVADQMPLVAGLLLGTAIAIKYMAVVAVPFLAARAWRTSRLAGTLVVLLCAIVPYLSAQPFKFGEAAANTLATVGSQLSMSANWLLALPFFLSGRANAPALAGLAPLPYLGEVTWPRIIQFSLVLALAAVISTAVIRNARRQHPGNLFRSVAALLWTLPAMHPWYLTWLSPALATEGAWSVYASWYLALGLLVYAHEGLVLTPWREAVFALITLVLLVVPVIAARSQRLPDG